jgi:hypothetical protein
MRSTRILSTNSCLYGSIVAKILLNYLLPVIGNQLVAIVIAITAALILGTLTGALSGLMITRGKIAPFIATLGTMAIFRSLALFIGDAGEIRSSSFLYGEFGMNAVLFIPVPVFIMISVDLPAPLSPSNARISWSYMSISILSSACNPPNRLKPPRIDWFGLIPSLCDSDEFIWSLPSSFGECIVTD